MSRLLRFRSLQQKLGFYAFILSFGAMLTVSVLSDQVAREQVREDREQLMQVYARQMAQDLDNELRNAVRELQLWGEADFVQASLENSQHRFFAAFFDELIRQQKKYDLIFTINLDGRIAALNSIGRNEAGKSFEVLLPGLSPSWLRETIQSGKPYGIGWRQFARVNDLYQRNAANSAIERRYQLALAARVGDQAGEHPWGLIVAVLNWSYFQQILDRAAEGFRHLDLTTGYAFL